MPPVPTTNAPDSDRLTRFMLPRAGVRGVRVHLDDTWRQIRERDTSPDSGAISPAAMELLGEAAVAAALFTGHAKVDGRLSVQLRSHGALRTLFAECTAAGTLRGIVQVQAGATVSRDLRALGADALLAITIENPTVEGRDPVRYQSMVALQAGSLGEVFEDYFRQSEQLPTRLLLAVDGRHVAGLMLQKLPEDSGDEDGWQRANALFDTLSPQELLAWPCDLLLQRLFHEDAATVLGERPLAFACSCSRERVAAMLESLGQEEARAAVAAGPGKAEVRCEFCGMAYHFEVTEIDGLFTPRGRPMVAPERLQ